MMQMNITVSFLLLATVMAAQVVPMTNDACGSAIVLSNGVNPGAPFGLSGNVYTNVGATASSGSPTCQATFYPDVWFSYVATATGPLVVTTCPPAGFAAGTLSDTVLSVLAAGCPPTTQLGCDDDGGCDLYSQISVTVTMGTTYYIRVAGFAGAVGTFYLTVAPPPSNDHCTSPIALVVGANGPFTNLSATDSTAFASCAFGLRDLWFTYAPTCSGPVEVSTCGAGFDTSLVAYAACGATELACNDDFCGLSSRITFTGTAGAPTVIQVSSFDTSTGSFQINISHTSSTGMGLAFSSPGGAGTFRFDVTAGPPGGSFFLALTLNAGAFPTGWFYGVDIPLLEVYSLIGAGYPFLGPLNACGAHQFGPIGNVFGVPTFYAVAVGFAPGTSIPITNSSAVSYLIP